jgi:hypothetical protein
MAWPTANNPAIRLNPLPHFDDYFLDASWKSVGAIIGPNIRP